MWHSKKNLGKRIFLFFRGKNNSEKTSKAIEKREQYVKTSKGSKVVYKGFNLKPSHNSSVKQNLIKKKRQIMEKNENGKSGFKHSNFFRKLCYGFLVLAILAVIGFFLTFHFVKNTFDHAGPLEETKIILIEPASTIRTIAHNLKEANMIDSERLFIYNVTHENHASDLKAGEYQIPAHASMREIMEILRKGQSVEHSFTVPEGITVTDVFKRLKGNPLLVGDLPKKMPAEGSLLADTVTFTRGTSREKLVEYLKEKQTALVDEIWAKRDRDLPIKTKEELVTLASIVEKETGVSSERPLIAAVFCNRLKKKMRLQSDPTILYGLFGGEGKPSGRAIYRSDLISDTPYNTYRINGLPPTPIAIPGKAALEAVAHPAKTKALYFVAKGNGEHAFSQTLEEHNQNVQVWRKIKKKLDETP